MGVYYSSTVPVLRENKKAIPIKKSANKIISPILLTEPVNKAWISIIISMKQVTIRLLEITDRMGDLGRSLLCHNIKLKPKAQAPEIRVLKIPAGVKLPSSKDMLKVGATR